MSGVPANAEVDYTDAETGSVIETARFYDPGLDENSRYSRQMKARGTWNGRHLTYGCGRPLIVL